MQGAMGGNMFAGADPMQARLQEELQKAIERTVPGYQIIQIITVGLGLLLSVGMLTSGIGLLRLSSSARTMTIIFTSISIASYLFQAVYQFAFVMPAMSNAFRAILPGIVGPAPPQALQAMQSMMTVIGIATVFVYALVIAYLAVILILLLRSSARQAFLYAGQGYEPRFDPDRYRDERDEPRRREGDDDDWDYRRPPDDKKDEGHYR